MPVAGLKSTGTETGAPAGKKNSPDASLPRGLRRNLPADLRGNGQRVVALAAVVLEASSFIFRTPASGRVSSRQLPRQRGYPGAR